MATRLCETLQTLENLKQATITNPLDVAQLPHMTFIHSLKISGLSTKCNDWQWMKDTANLQVLKLQIVDTNVATTDEVNNSSKLLVRDKKTTIVINSPGTIDLLGNVLECLPSHLRDEVSSVQDSISGWFFKVDM